MNMDRDIFTQSRIFIIDDEQANIKVLQRMLGSQGYEQLVPFIDPRLVLDAYQQNRPDLILLDINMPHMDGFQVIEELKALNDPLLPPIVILTAQHGKDMLLKALSAGARDFVGKPFDRTELLMRVRNLLEAQMAHRLLHDQKAALDELVKLRTIELKHTQLEIVRRLGRAAEYRDNETGMHIIRMSKFSAIMAKSMGWSSDRCDLIMNASPMHDIGKIGISDSVLLKPGKFEPNEWEAMKTHSSIGAELLSGDASELLAMASSIALCHHEKWDGSGYPQGLKAENIPIEARIAAIADVFDALTSTRPYKKAWPIEDAVNHIKENAGSHFDPSIVKHFLHCLPEILAVREHYPDS